jgi:hypothetical protein
MSRINFFSKKEEEYLALIFSVSEVYTFAMFAFPAAVVRWM